ncbi:MAG: aldo/keto reductase [Myxococcota bacterium]
MQYTYLGKTGLKVSELCLGAMTFGPDWGWGADEPTSRAIFDAYVGAGGNFVDTANVYTNGTSETFVGRFIKGRRDRFVVATKYTISTDGADANAYGNGRKSFMRALENSLKRLGTDYIDLYYAHMWDGYTPVDETMRAMEDACRQGKILHVGLSDFPAWLVARADAIAELSRTVRPAAIQIEYNLLQRDADRELIPMADSLGLSILDWSPLAGGTLTGKTLNDADDGRVSTGAVGHFDKYKTESVEKLVRKLLNVAQTLQVSPAQLAIAWLRAVSPLHIPIVGARSVEHIRDNLRATELKLDGETLLAIDELTRASLGFPSDFLASGWPAWFGAWPARIDPRVRPRARRALRLDDDQWPRRPSRDR